MPDPVTRWVGEDTPSRPYCKGTAVPAATCDLRPEWMPDAERSQWRTGDTHAERRGGRAPSEGALGGGLVAM